MLTIQPLLLIADGVDNEGLHRYRVRFNREGTEIEYIFTVDDTDITCVKGDDEFVKTTFRDPLVPALYQSILKFHEARQLANSAQPQTTN